MIGWDGIGQGDWIERDGVGWGCIGEDWCAALVLMLHSDRCVT